MKILSLIFFLVIIVSASAQKLVLPGDYPDPSVVKIGNEYWATATTSNWAPVFPLMKSGDLITWTQHGHVFNQLPEWADYYFWAPEISYENGKVYVYYAAHKKNGNLCLGIASADRPEGPYKDHGPIMCQEAGSIDAFPTRDENGKLYLIWKEDGNSVKKPTPIWAMEMNEERTALVGEKVELFRNDKEWEGNLVEGVSVVRKGEYFYAFYAARGCCGASCNYATGVARAKKLLGPWEKFNKNPLMIDNDNWLCPGHGTPVEYLGKNFFLYHGYSKQSSIFTGREGLLSEFRYTNDGWIEFVPDSSAVRNVKGNFVDEFDDGRLNSQWQWSVFNQPVYTLRNGTLILNANSGGSYLGKKVMNTNYSATAEIDLNASTAKGGIGAVSDDKNMFALLASGTGLQLVQIKNGNESVLTIINQQFKRVTLKMEVRDNKMTRFYYSKDGKTFTIVGQAVSNDVTPPWDRALRIGIISKGNSGQRMVFRSFKLLDL